MALQQLIEQQLSHLASLGGGQLAVALPTGSVECDIERVDPLGVAFKTFVYLTNRLAQAETVRLTKIADALSAKLSYLLEPLRVIEIDGPAGAVQMRSAPPCKQATQLTYYEVLVQRGGSISLMRYEKQPAQTRSPVTTIVTREVFARLANDFEEASQ